MTTTLKDWFRNTSDSENKKIMLLDGGVSTHLRDLCDQHPKGHPLRADWYPELWSSSLLMTLDGRATILQGHQDWLAAGTQILTTVTYQCGMVNAIVKDETTVKQMLADGVQLARQAISQQHNGKEEDKFVVASMGCYGAALADGSEYTGHYPNIQSEQELQDFHRSKTLTLLQQKPDGIALETVPCVMECRAFIQLLQELQQQDNNDKNCACWISFACRNGHELNDGSKLEEALQAIQELDPEATIIHAIGVNCCDSQYIPSLVQIIADFLMAKTTTARRGVIVYPNSGEEWDGQTKEWKQGTGLRHNEDVFAKRLIEAVEIVERTWKNAGNSNNNPPPRMVLGGCCRTRPATIRALRTLVDQRQTASKKQESPASLTSEQERMLARIMGREADFDRQLGEIGEGLQDLADTQQLQTEHVQKQAATIKKAKDKAPH